MKSLFKLLLLGLLMFVGTSQLEAQPFQVPTTDEQTVIINVEVSNDNFTQINYENDSNSFIKNQIENSIYEQVSVTGSSNPDNIYNQVQYLQKQSDQTSSNIYKNAQSRIVKDNYNTKYSTTETEALATLNLYNQLE